MKIITTFILLATVVHVQSQDVLTPEKFRRDVSKRVADRVGTPYPVKDIANDFVINGNDSIPIRIYRPDAQGELPIIYNVHGAAFAAGDLETHDNICRYFTMALNAVVVAVDYRRAPENKFPAPLDDTYAVFKWINAHVRKLKGNGKLILLGDNAGANLIASVCLKNLQEKQPAKITVQVLVSPALDLRKTSVVYKTYPILIDWYLNEADERDNHYISPLLANQYSRLPPAIIVVGEKEEIRNDGETYHKKLRDAGIQSNLYIQPNMGHLSVRWFAADREAMPAMDYVVTSLKEFYLP